jgi:mono/diheme cytochrome c family protein
MTDQQRADATQVREHPEPIERNNPVPWLLGLVASCLCVWGVSYFLLNPNLGRPVAGDSATATAAGQATVGQATVGQATPATAQAAAPAAADGGQIFTSRCASCHQATGAGLPGVFPPLAGSEWVNGDGTTMAGILLLGITGPITVKGASFSGMMPAFDSSLSDAEIAAVASHVRSSFGNHSPAVTADVVKAERAKLGSRTTPWAGEAELKAQH